MKMIGYRPDTETLRRIKLVAKAENRPLATMVHEIVKRWLASQSAEVAK